MLNDHLSNDNCEELILFSTNCGRGIQLKASASLSPWLNVQGRRLCLRLSDHAGMGSWFPEPGSTMKDFSASLALANIVSNVCALPSTVTIMHFPLKRYSVIYDTGLVIPTFAV